MGSGTARKKQRESGRAEALIPAPLVDVFLTNAVRTSAGPGRVQRRRRAAGRRGADDASISTPTRRCDRTGLMTEIFVWRSSQNCRPEKRWICHG